MARDKDDLKGVVATLGELIAVRPKIRASAYAGQKNVRTLRFGGHRSSLRGRGMEFDEVRGYHPGDDIRAIDWRVTARTGKPHTKLFQEERERPVLVVLDLRSPMVFGTRRMFKSVQAARAAAFVCFVSLDGGDRIGGVILTDTGLELFAPRRGRAEALGLIKAMAQGTQQAFAHAARAPSAHAGEKQTRGPQLGDALARVRQASRPGTLVFVVSDFHDFDAKADREMDRLAAHCEVANLMIQDDLEEHAPPPGTYRVCGEAQIGMLDLDGAGIARAYARHFAARTARIADFSRRRGLIFQVLRPETEPKDLLAPMRLQPDRKGGR